MIYYINNFIFIAMLILCNSNVAAFQNSSNSQGDEADKQLFEAKRWFNLALKQEPTDENVLQVIKENIDNFVENRDATTHKHGDTLLMLALDIINGDRNLTGKIPLKTATNCIDQKHDDYIHFKCAQLLFLKDDPQGLNNLKSYLRSNEVSFITKLFCADFLINNGYIEGFDTVKEIIETNRPEAIGALPTLAKFKKYDGQPYNNGKEIINIKTVIDKASKEIQERYYKYYDRKP